MTTQNGMKPLFNNTYERTSVSFLIVPEKGKYKAVCLEFDLIEEASSKEEAQRLIEDHAEVWFRNAAKNRLPLEVLNRPAPKKYWNIFKKLVEHDQNKLEAEEQNKPKIEITPPRAAKAQTFYPEFAF